MEMLVRLRKKEMKSADSTGYTIWVYIGRMASNRSVPVLQSHPDFQPIIPITNSNYYLKLCLFICFSYYFRPLMKTCVTRKISTNMQTIKKALHRKHTIEMGRAHMEFGVFQFCRTEGQLRNSYLALNLAVLAISSVTPNSICTYLNIFRRFTASLKPNCLC